MAIALLVAVAVLIGAAIGSVVCRVINESHRPRVVVVGFLIIAGLCGVYAAVLVTLVQIILHGRVA